MIKIKNKTIIVSILAVILIGGGFYIYIKNDFALRINRIVSKNNPAQAVLSPYVINHGARDQKIVALTFDADMTPLMSEELRTGKVKSWYNEQVVEALNKFSVPATFFVTGMWAELYPDAIRQFVLNPLFEIENHSYDHSAFLTPCYHLAQAKDKREEVLKAQNIISTLTGYSPKFFRFPGGCFSKKDVKLVEDLGLRVVAWDVISGDSFLKNKKSIVNSVLNKVEDGSIIVLHLNGGPRAPGTALALPEIISGLKSRGYSFVKIEDLFIN